MVLLGGSGSGKTTLLNALAGRLGSLPVLEGGLEFRRSGPERSGDKSAMASEDKTEGRKERRERKRDEKGSGRRIGFVRQSDYLSPHLTGKSLTKHSPNRSSSQILD